MRLESAFRTGSEGITAHGQAISVIGDNIANANTTAYKSQRAEFSDILGEKVDDRLASIPGGGGDGVKVGRVRLDFDSGVLNGTGRELDVAISGRGFFLVGGIERPALTRTGNFQIDPEGFLVTSDGLRVLGYTGAAPEVLGPVSMTDLQTEPIATTNASVWGNLDGGGGLNPLPENPESFLELSRAAGFVSTQSVYDALGERHDLQFFYFRTGANQWTVRSYINGADVGQGVDQPVLLGSVNLTFDQQGYIPEENAAQAVLNVNPAWANGAAATPIAVDFSSFTQFSGGARITNVTQNGRGDGDIVGYEFGEGGEIYAMLNNGMRTQAGTLAIGLVANVDGLQRLGAGLYEVTQQSGALAIDRPKTGGRGVTMGRSLEASNVDLPGQFTEMIVLQRGYQASSQVLSTANDIIKNTIALVR